MSRWFIAFSARKPDDPEGSKWEIGIQERRFRRLQEQGHTVPLGRILLVRDTLENTVSIIGGWSRPDKDDCFAYVGRPSRDFRGATIETPAPPGMLFVVFVLPDGEIEHWTWRRQSEGDPDVPEGMGEKVIWRQNKS